MKIKLNYLYLYPQKRFQNIKIKNNIKLENKSKRESF